MDSFETQDMLYHLFISDNELMSFMGNPSNDEEKNLRFRREEFDITEINSECYPFLTIIFVDTDDTRNYLKNMGLLEINIYSSGRYDAMLICKRVRAILKKYFPEIKIIAEGQVYTEVRGVFCYRTRYNPIINS